MSNIANDLQQAYDNGYADGFQKGKECGVVHCCNCACWSPLDPWYDEDLHRYFAADEGICTSGTDTYTKGDFFCGWGEEV